MKKNLLIALFVCIVPCINAQSQWIWKGVKFETPAGFRVDVNNSDSFEGMIDGMALGMTIFDDPSITLDNILEIIGQVAVSQGFKEVLDSDILDEPSLKGAYAEVDKGDGQFILYVGVVNKRTGINILISFVYLEHMRNAVYNLLQSFEETNVTSNTGSGTQNTSNNPSGSIETWAWHDFSFDTPKGFEVKENKADNFFGGYQNLVGFSMAVIKDITATHDNIEELITLQAKKEGYDHILQSGTLRNGSISGKFIEVRKENDTYGIVFALINEKSDINIIGYTAYLKGYSQMAYNIVNSIRTIN